MKKALALILALVMVLALAACGGGTEAATTSSGVNLTIFNSKMEIQSQMEEMAAQYSKEKGVNVEVYYSSDTVAAHMSTKYASNDPYVISMVDAKDIYSLGPEHAIDLSAEKWVGDTTQAISVDGKVLGFPVCVEARGILYNADAIKAVTGEDFDPAAVKTTADLESVIAKLVAGGMEAPVGLQKEDWSLGAHYFAEVYEQQDDPDAFIAGIKDGSIVPGSLASTSDIAQLFDINNELDALGSQLSSKGSADFADSYGEIVNAFSGIGDLIPDKFKGLYETLVKLTSKANLKAYAKALPYLAKSKRGFNLFEISDSGKVNVKTVTDEGFGDPFNHGLRIFCDTDDYMVATRSSP